MPITRPENLEIPFASDGVKNTIPVAPSGALASYEGGFPPVTMQPIVTGGVPPQGKDFNGIFYDITAHTVWVNAGGQYLFDSDLCDAIGGYPAGMVLQNNAGTASYVSMVNGNTTDFNTTPASIGTLWQPWAGAALQLQGVTWCGTSGGSANAQTFTPTPAISEYAAGLALAGVAGFTNTGAMTINVSGLGALNVYKDSQTGPSPLTGGEWVAGNAVSIRHDGTRFQLTDTDLGDLALLNVGAGLRANPLTKNLDANLTTTNIAVDTAINSTRHEANFICTNALNLTAVATSTLWNGFNVAVKATNGNVTFTPNAADNIENTGVGLAYVLTSGSSATFVTDGAGNWWIEALSLPTSSTEIAAQKAANNALYQMGLLL